MSCGQMSSNDVNQDVIYTNYEASYDEMTGALEVSADFTVGGNRSTYIQLDEPSKVYINGRTGIKDENILNQIFYKYSAYYEDYLNIGMIPISYTNADERTFNNSSRIPSRISFNLNSSSLQKGEDLRINYQIDDTTDGANLLYLHLDYQNGKMTRFISSSLAEHGNVTVYYEQMNQMVGKSVNAYLCRSKISKSINHPGEGGSFKTEFCSKRKTFFVN